MNENQKYTFIHVRTVLRFCVIFSAIALGRPGRARRKIIIGRGPTQKIFYRCLKRVSPTTMSSLKNRVEMRQILLWFIACCFCGLSGNTFAFPVNTRLVRNNGAFAWTQAPTQRLLVQRYLSSGDGGGEQRRSRFAGNQREATAREIAIMDDMITKLMNAKPYELPSSVSQAFRVVSSPRFFLRIAERSDMASSDEEKKKLTTLADNLASTVAAVVSTAKDKMDECASIVETIVKAAAEPSTGEFLVPLSADRIAAMQSELKRVDPDALNEGFLSTVDSWMNKSMQDGLDGMVVILQKVLQLYAGTQISRARTQLQTKVAAALTGQSPKEHEETMSSNGPPAILLEDLLNMDTDKWDVEIRNRVGEDNDSSRISKSALMGEVQRTIEGVVLGLESGSMAQRVQAEYLRELSSKIEAIAT